MSIPKFFKYDKNEISKLICKDFQINCFISGKINYSFFPSPRLQLNEILIEDFSYKEKALAKIKNVSVKVSFINLLNKKMLNFNQVELKNAEININLKEYAKYKNFLKEKPSLRNINMQNAVINFFDEKNVATITNASFKYKLKKESIIFKLNGNFLNDKISINFDNNLSKANQSKILILKLADAKLFTKMELINSKLNNNITSGNILFKKNQTKIIGIFDYKNNKIIIKNANLRNSFLDSKFSGEVQFLPYLNFNLDIDLSTLNFNRLYNFLITLNKEERKKLFKINKKLNGAFNVSVDKIYSKYTFIDTFESRIRFVNGDIVFEQLLLNLKKLGAVDVTGIIKNEEKFSIFKFEQNIFIDNLKTFFSRFGIHNKKKIPYDLFVAGNLNLTSFILHLHEISSASKFEEEDINYIEREFNDILLNKDYESFFNFVNLKEFVQSISLESN